jgi:HlyD family secretion protein
MTVRGRRLGLGLILAVGLGSAFWFWQGSAVSAPGEEWAAVHREDLVSGLPVTGTLEAVDSARLGPPPIPEIWDYKIAFMAPEGALVRAGQPVLAFDASELQRTLIEKSSERDTAAKQLEKRGNDLEVDRRDIELSLAEAEGRRRKAALKVDVPPELESGQKLAEARADLALAEREIAYRREKLALRRREARAELEALAATRDAAAGRVRQVEASIARMTILAPRDGTVIYAIGPRGDKKKIGDSCWRSETPIQLPDLTRMRAMGSVEEADAGRVAVGQAVTLRLDAHPDVLFQARVASIGSTFHPRSQSEPQRVVDLKLDLPRTDPQRMRPGMRFVGTLEVARTDRALVVPVEAIFPTAGGAVVYRRGRFGREAVRPRLGRRDDRWVEILSGLRDGDRVALPASAGDREAGGNGKAAPGAAPADGAAGAPGKGPG